ncbi:ankyrin repeat and EF-hand domain-containing protein 1-like [Xenia sp. Carnegie-2017]|uniref:ankyrin repeat and EF-hand domain-containing protein 1-like n=1 Tax=Xenia sp. Carnegie-2017 TaxID=2897299 RepID=UPI001F04F635|nr:ankyrin repeat and EF-hand domain-containing protein 1-like [Xenia sp. Carnegie-2017]
MMWSEIGLSWTASEEWIKGLYNCFYLWRNVIPTNNITCDFHALTKGKVSGIIGSLFILIFIKITLLLLKYLFYGHNKLQKEKLQIPQSVYDMAKMAYKPEHCNAVIQFIKRKPNVDMNKEMPILDTTDTKMTLFLCACFSGSERLLRFCLSYGADIQRRTKWADTPLHLVTFALSRSQCRNFGSMDVLLRAGCDINCKNWIGNTPLCIAACHGNLMLIRYLLRKGADPSIANRKGIYPIDFANNADNREAADLLKFHVSNSHVWEVIDPHTPPKIRLGLQSPSKQHLIDSTFTRRRSIREKYVS